MTSSSGSSPMEMTRVSARWRIVGWIVLTTLLALMAVVVTMRTFLLNEVAEAANGNVVQEFREFEVFAEDGMDPTTAKPFTSTEEFMERYLSRQTPATGEAIIAVVGGRVMFSDNARDDLGEELAQDRTRLRELTEATENSGVADTEHGEMRWGTMTAQAKGDHRNGTLVVVQFTQEARETVNGQIAVLVGIAIGGLLLTAGIAWLVAGRILEPIRTMRKVTTSVSAHDLSTRIPVEGRDDISQLAMAINRMLDRVERSYGSQQHFVAEAQRRLNVPLSRTAEAVEELAMVDGSGARRREAADSARRQLAFMRRTLAYLDVLAASDKPGFLHRRAVSLKELTAEGYATVAQAYPQRRWVLEGTGEARAWLDPERVSEALRQISRNAVDHTDRYDVIRLGSELVDEGRTARFWVANHGEPLTQEQAEQLLEMYRSEDSSDDDTGMGLGLAVVRAVADAHGGSVWVESDPRDGTRFGLDLPVRGPGGEGGAEDPEDTEPGEQPVEVDETGRFSAVRRDGADARQDAVGETDRTRPMPRQDGEDRPADGPRATGRGSS